MLRNKRSLDHQTRMDSTPG